MASLGGSLRQAGVSSSRGLRPNLSRRPPSSSSEASYASDGSASDDQFVFSAGNTPTHEYPRSATLAAREDLLFGKQAPAATSDSSDAAGLARSKPIAIELPPVRGTFLYTKILNPVFIDRILFTWMPPKRGDDLCNVLRKQ
ncbi:hypothetical protein OQA88_4529 [Cercophora sp. LCS_1]